jgi:hypothetical protein
MVVQVDIVIVGNDDIMVVQEDIVGRRRDTIFESRRLASWLQQLTACILLPIKWIHINFLRRRLARDRIGSNDDSDSIVIEDTTINNGRRVTRVEIGCPSRETKVDVIILLEESVRPRTRAESRCEKARLESRQE